jgi:hypothetical protein
MNGLRKSFRHKRQTNKQIQNAIRTNKSIQCSDTPRNKQRKLTSVGSNKGVAGGRRWRAQRSKIVE